MKSGFGIGLVAWLVVAPVAARAFDFADVSAKAEELSHSAFDDSHGRVPKWLLELTYDQWRDIRFRTDQALWLGDKGHFTIQFFHPGLFYDRSVGINVVDGKDVGPLPYSAASFDYGKNDFAGRTLQDLGYAGLRVHYPINRADYRDEVIVFVGASYFRAVAKGLAYGLSARGLAVDTGMPTPEEFPFFRDFWLVRPKPGATQMEIFAVLDGRSATGAYRFVVHPGDHTTVDVQSKLFPRRADAKLGIAPLTSMFFHGENTTRRFDDFRPEVHDSDGLLLQFEGGEWQWRPLDNPETIQLNSFRMPNPKGFGLVQRDRDPESYQELETRSEDRPSVWIVPRGAWGDGHVELLELPSKSEINDNIVAFWVPEKRPKPGEPMSFDYELDWYREERRRPPGGRAVATRIDHGTVLESPPPAGTTRFVVDFEGERLKALAADAAVRPVVSVGAATGPGEELVDQHLEKNGRTGRWRLGFQVRPKEKKPLELRAFLQRGGEALTETWSYTLLP